MRLIFRCNILLFICASFYCCSDKTQNVDRNYIPYNHYLDSDSTLFSSSANEEEWDCVDDIRINRLRDELPAIVDWTQRDTSVISTLVREMESCDSIFFESDPIYYMLDCIYNKELNSEISFRQGVKSYEIFKSHNDTSGMVNVLYNIARTSDNSKGKSIDLLNEKLLTLAKASSNDADKMIYYDSFFRNMLIDEKGIDTVDYTVYLDEVKLILQRDTTLVNKYSNILGVVGSIEFRRKCYSRAYDLVTENYFLPNAYRNFVVLINYAEVFDESSEQDSIRKYYRLAREEYLQSSYRVLDFESYYYSEMSKYYHKNNDFDNAWKYRDLKDSIVAISTINKKKKEVSELKTRLVYDIEKLDNEWLKGTRNILMGIVVALGFLLLALVFLVRNYRNSKKKDERNLKFKENAFKLLSHDLLSPLQALTEYVAIVKSDVANNKNLNIQKSLAVISDNVNRLSDLAHSTIDYIWQSRKSSKVQSLRYVYENSVQFYNLFSVTKNVSITNYSDEETLDAQVKFPDSIAAIIRNIISNITKHNDAKHIFIKSEIQRNILIIEIVDDASPLSDANLINIKQTISRSFNSEVVNNHRAGIGLSIIRDKLYKTSSKLAIEPTAEGNRYTLKIPQ